LFLLAALDLAIVACFFVIGLGVFPVAVEATSLSFQISRYGVSN
jgi:hypothetical protein